MLHHLLKLLYQLRHKNSINILIYHQVLAAFDPMRPLEPTAQDFEWQMQLLSKYFTPLSLDEAVDALHSNTVPANAVVVTFDDGYLNNLTIAQPILEKYKIPATYYIATGFSQGKNMWNDRVISLFANRQYDSLVIDDEVIALGAFEQRRELAYEQLLRLKHLQFNEREDVVNRWYQVNQAQEALPLMMTPAQVKELSDREGVTIGAHTVDHPILMVHSEQEQMVQVSTSRALLEEWIGLEVKHFAYPNGKAQKDYDQTSVNIVKACGFKSAVTTDHGKCGLNENAFTLPRFTPWDKTPLKFHLRLTIS